MNHLLFTLYTGIGATLIMDLWGIVRRPLLGWPTPDYALVGRWVGHLASGRVRHPAITVAAAVRGERAIGWIAHYLTGIAFAALLVAFGGAAWLARPTLVPALAVGVGTLVVPFCIVQPAMGAGFAAARTPRPAAARLQSFVTHLVFGLGLYVAGLSASLLNIP